MKKINIILLSVFAVMLATTADANVLGTVKSVIEGSTLSIVAWAAGLVIMVIGKIIPNDKLDAWSTALGKGIGVSITFGAAQWKWTKPIWNKTIEPFVIDLLLYGVIGFFKGIITGMKSDNDK